MKLAKFRIGPVYLYGRVTVFLELTLPESIEDAKFDVLEDEIQLNMNRIVAAVIEATKEEVAVTADVGT